jgi:hypothetical protein
MRHLISVLVGSGNYVDAEQSLDAYLLIVENEEKTLAKSHGQNRKLEDQDIITTDVDSHENILRAMADGIGLLVKYQNKGKKAMDLGQKLEQELKTWDIENPDILAVAHHAIGIACSLWSTQSIFLM